MLTLLASGLISSFPLWEHQYTHLRTLSDSLDPVNLVHVIGRRDLKPGIDVGAVDLALAARVGFRTGSGSRCRRLGGGCIRALAPALFTGSANVGCGVLLEGLALEGDSRDTAAAEGSA